MKQSFQPEVFVASQLTRKELKQDKFAVEVEHTVDYFAAHRKQTLRLGVSALIVILIGAGFYYFRNSQQATRQEALGEALTLANAQVGAAQPGSSAPTFPTDAAKNDAVTKAFNKIVTDYGGTDEGYIAEYYMAANTLASGRPDEASKKYQEVADHADANFASLAKLALAQIDAADNKMADAEKLFKDLVNNPTALVSKAQATIAYAKAIANTRPDEARKMLTELAAAKDQGDVGAIATRVLSELPQK
jgi:predicted negative regulator of RcsB-dependent stress response